MASWRACLGGCSSAWGAAEAGIFKAGANDAPGPLPGWSETVLLSVQQTFGVGVQLGQGVAGGTQGQALFILGH